MRWDVLYQVVKEVWGSPKREDPDPQDPPPLAGSAPNIIIFKNATCDMGTLPAGPQNEVGCIVSGSEGRDSWLTTSIFVSPRLSRFQQLFGEKKTTLMEIRSVSCSSLA